MTVFVPKILKIIFNIKINCHSYSTFSIKCNPFVLFFDEQGPVIERISALK